MSIPFILFNDLNVRNTLLVTMKIDYHDNKLIYYYYSTAVGEKSSRKYVRGFWQIIGEFYQYNMITVYVYYGK